MTKILMRAMAPCRCKFLAILCYGWLWLPVKLLRIDDEGPKPDEVGEGGTSREIEADLDPHGGAWAGDDHEGTRGSLISLIPGDAGYEDSSEDSSGLAERAAGYGFDGSEPLVEGDAGYGDLTSSEASVESSSLMSQNISATSQRGSEACKDKDHHHCVIYAKQGYCKSRLEWMKGKGCHRSCCLCPEDQGLIYGIGTNWNIYATSVCTPGATAPTGWQHAGNGAVKNIIAHTPTGGHETMLYGIGMNNNIYVQLLCQMKPGSPWHHKGRGDVYHIGIAEGSLYGIGMNHNIYKQSLSSLSPHSGWHHAGAGSVKFFVLDQGFIWGVGMSNHVWNQKLSGMSPRSGWQRKTRPAVYKIAIYQGGMYGIGTNHNVYHQKLKGISIHTHWRHVSSGVIHTMIFYGNALYGVGLNQNVYKKNVQSTGSLVRGSLVETDDSNSSVPDVDGGPSLLETDDSDDNLGEVDSSRWWRRRRRTRRRRRRRMGGDWKHHKHGNVVGIIASNACGKGLSLKNNKFQGEWKYLGNVGIATKCISEGVTTTRGKEQETSVGGEISASLTVGTEVGVPGVGGADVEVSTTISASWGQSWTNSFSHAKETVKESCLDPSSLNAHHRWQWVLTAIETNGNKNEVYTGFNALTRHSGSRPLCLPGCATDDSDVFASYWDNSKQNPNGVSYQNCHNTGDFCHPCGWLDQRKCR